MHCAGMFIVLIKCTEEEEEEVVQTVWHINTKSTAAATTTIN